MIGVVDEFRKKFGIPKSMDEIIFEKLVRYLKEDYTISLSLWNDNITIPLIHNVANKHLNDIRITRESRYKYIPWSSL